MSDLFNWYIVGSTIRGDVCVRHYRKNEYIQEKIANKSMEYIKKRDAEDKSRAFVFIQEPIKTYDAESGIVTTRNGSEYVLHNMDSYFVLRKQEQLSALARYISHDRRDR